MKKLKNNWFSAGMALAMMWGIGLGILPEKARAQQTGYVYETTFYIRILGGKLCGITECTPNAGTDCDTPGAKFRNCIGLGDIR